MAISQVETLLDGANAAANALDQDFAVAPANGTHVICAGACFFPDGTGTISFSNPSSLTTRQNQDAGGNLAAMLYGKDAGASEGTAVDWDKTGDAEALAAIAINVDGSNGYDTSGKATTDSDTELTVTADDNTTTDGSRAYLFIFVQQPSGGYTPTTPTGWTLIDEEHSGASNLVGAHVYYKDVDSGSAASGTFSRTGTAARIKGFVYVVGPGNADPVLTVPGAQRYVRGKAHVISGVSAVDADNDESVVTLTCNKGTFAAPTPTNVDVAGENTASMTLTGTTTELNAYFAAGNGPTYTHSSANHDADTITINWDDQVGTADEETIAVTCVDFLLNAPDIATFNTVLGTLTYEEGTAKTVSLTIGAEDDGGRTDTEVSTITVAHVMAQLNLAIQLFKRRRKWI